VRALALGVLPRPESVALLVKLLAGDDAQSATLDAIAEEVGDLPLALHVAGELSVPLPA
jgi:hypothetical protein